MKKSIDVLRMAFPEPELSWVLFRHGTCMVLPDLPPGEDLAQCAKDLLARVGPVIPGTPAGDFDPMRLRDGLGWLVSYPHAEMFSYVEASDVPSADDPRLAAGLLGRENRAKDAEELAVAHVEDRRSVR